MANLQQTYSGDLTSALAGTIANKVLNAAGMSKAESERRETQGLEKAQPGSLFASALGHEFGGDLYNRTLGNFDSKKPIGQTDRSSSKEARFKAKYAGIQGGPVQKAQDAMGEDDGSLSVKDEKTRQLTAKILGSSVEQKLNVVEFSVNQLGSEIKSLNSNLSQTNSLILDQNLMLGAKFDVLLEHFTANRKFQEEIVEEGKVQRREQELEKSKDLSSALKLKDIESSKGKSKSNLLQNLLGDLIKSYVGAKTKGLAQTLLGTLSNLGKKNVNWAGSAYRFLKSTLGIGGDIAGRDPLYASKAFDDKIANIDKKQSDLHTKIKQNREIAEDTLHEIDNELNELNYFISDFKTQVNDIFNEKIKIFRDANNESRKKASPDYFKEEGYEIV